MLVVFLDLTDPASRNAKPACITIDEKIKEKRLFDNKEMVHHMAFLINRHKCGKYVGRIRGASRDFGVLSQFLRCMKYNYWIEHVKPWNTYFYKIKIV